jgi:hypothetical protein
MNFKDEHLEVLRSIGPAEQTWVGGKLQPYARSVTDHQSGVQIQLLPNSSIGREYLFSMASKIDVNTLTCCVAIFAWGGMRRDHARELLKNYKKWIHIADLIRTQRLSRCESYSLFMETRGRKDLPGMGPAFFTKLIYFLGRNAPTRGYIMDQWTARSANLLSGRQLVSLVRVGKALRVADKNSEKVYDEFCSFIEELSLTLKETPDQAEMRIFSSGGRDSKAGHWRMHVRQQPR